jgi:hypothetical protein
MPYGSASARLSKPVRSMPVPPSPCFGAVRVWDGKVASHPLYDIELDPQGCLIMVRTRGFWSVEDVDAYFGVLNELVSASRARFGRVKLLADVTEAPIQSPEVAGRFAMGNAIFREPGDKMALITGSSLQKMQIRRALTSDRTQVFVSRSAALMWINAFP